MAIGDQPVVRTQRGARSVGTLNKPRSVFSNLGFLSILADMLAVIIAITTSFTVVVVGTLPVAEGLMLALLPVILVVRGKRLNRSIFRTVFALLALWLANQVFTDIYRQTATKDWLRGNAAIVFFLIDLTFLVMLLGQNQRRKILFVASYAIGSLLATRFQPTDLALQEPWKFGYSNGLTILSVLVAAYLYDKRRYEVSLSILVCIIGANLLENYRSPVLNILLAVALTMPLIPEQVGTIRLLPRKRNKGAHRLSRSHGACGRCFGAGARSARDSRRPHQRKCASQEQDAVSISRRAPDCRTAGNSCFIRGSH